MSDVQCYGSHVTGLSLSGSDVDATILTKEYVDERRLLSYAANSLEKAMASAPT